MHMHVCTPHKVHFYSRRLAKLLLFSRRVLIFNTAAGVTPMRARDWVNSSNNPFTFARQAKLILKKTVRVRLKTASSESSNWFIVFIRALY